MSARRILIPVHDFSAGGTELIALRLARRWAADGRSVTVLAGAADGPLRERVPEDVAVRVLTPERPRSALSRVALGRQMAPTAWTLDPDAVFIPGNFHFMLARALQRALPRAAIVAKASNAIWNDGALPHVLARVGAAFVTAGIGRIVAMAPALRSEAARYVDPRRVSVIADPFLDDETVVRARAGTPARPGHPLRILTVGRLEEQKDPLLALAVLAELHRRGHDIALEMLGAGPLEAQLRARIEQLGLGGRVTLAGYVADPRPAYARADLLLMTSRFEGVPAVIGEALATGLPFVTTDCSAWLSALAAGHPTLGDVAAERTPAALAETLLARRERPYPAAEAIEAAIGAHRIGEAAARYLALFDSMLNHPARRPSRGIGPAVPFTGRIAAETE